MEQSVSPTKSRCNSKRMICCQRFGKKLRLVFTLIATLVSFGSAPTAYAVCCLEDPPDTPTGLSGPGTDADGTYTISWNQSVGAFSYKLREKIGSGSWTVHIGPSHPKLRTFSKNVVETYTYMVAACNSEGCSSYSSSITVDVTGGITSPVEEEEDVADLKIGTAPYGIDVAADGDAIISVPINAIPGVAGFAPSLSIEYDSGRGIDRLEQSLPEDTLGYGWRLAGLSEIRRCVVDQASGNSIGLDNDDSLCLNGMPLVLASGTRFSVGAIYRTQIESYIKIAVKGTTGALWFEARLPDGTTQEYGNNGGSRVDDGGGVDFQWSLNKETSPDGNVIDYSYWHDVANGVNRIGTIDYTDATVHFEYLDRTDAATVSIGADSQTRAAFLHTVRVEYDSTKVREYRLLDEVVASRRRLEKIQLCGYDEAGTTAKCLSPLEFGWLAPTSTMSGVPILVDSITDGLSAEHEIDYDTITDSSHPAEFTEEPFGAEGTPGTNTQLLTVLPGNDALRYVVKKLRRDDGLDDINSPPTDSDFHVTTYAYQSRGVESTKHWGFLGFYAQRITDEQSGVVTYIQYRMDYPYFGQVAQVRQYDDVSNASGVEILTRSEREYDKEVISHTEGNSEYLHNSVSVDFIYESGEKLGASRTDNDLSFASGFITQVDSTSQTGTSMGDGSGGSFWGDIQTSTLGGIENTTESTVEFNNKNTGTLWTIGFADDVTTESWAGPVSGAGIVQDMELLQSGSSLRPSSIWRFKDDLELTLYTGFGYQSLGRMTSTTVYGDNVSSRVTSTSLTFVDDRYPSSVTNAKNQTTNFSAYDSRFGTVKTRGDINSRNTTWVRDEFGRVTSVTNPDSLQTTTTYTDCPTGCSISIYDASPRFYVTTDSAATPIQKVYYDKLGRVIRTATESFDGTDYSLRDIGYDNQGRAETMSLPYFGSTSEDIVVSYDIRDRVTNVSRPDGSSTSSSFSKSGTGSGNRVVVVTTDYVLDADDNDDGIQVKRAKYDILGQLRETTDGYGATHLSSPTYLDTTTTFTYDANSNMLTAAVSDGTKTNTTTYTYDAAGNQKSIDGPNVGTVALDYTGLGEVLERTDEKGQVFDYDYDLLGRLEEIDIDNGTATHTWVWDTATYGAGKLKSRSNPGFTETYSYNSKSRLSSVVTNITPIGGSSGTNYTTSHTYDSYGRPIGTTHPGGFVLTRSYNTRGYLSHFYDGQTAIQTFNDLDAFGNSIDESYANGVDTVRTFDTETGRLKTIVTDTTSATFQNNAYNWRSNGTLESKINSPAYGLSTTRKEIYTYDVLNRVDLAKTYIGITNTRDLEYDYDDFGNIKYKTSSLAGDTDVTSYVYGDGTGTAGPHAVESVSINGVDHDFTYDDNGAVTRYDIDGTNELNDKWIAYNAFNQPTKIVIGNSLTDTTPEARDEFAYDPNGRRYARKTTWKDGGSTYTEDVAYLGAVEIITDNSSGSTQTITKTQLSANAMHVKIVGSTTDEFFEYAHRDHLGAIEAVTNDSGNILDNMAFEPFGSRKKKDWTANISSTEIDDLLDLGTGHSRKARGFTGHEHLDRTGFVHMNGRVYDPVLGRFLSPDPYVQFPTSSQSWNRYSYVNNSPASFSDPSGFFQDITDGGSTNADGYGGTIGGGIVARSSVWRTGGSWWTGGEDTHVINPNGSEYFIPQVSPHFSLPGGGSNVAAIPVGHPISNGNSSTQGNFAVATCWMCPSINLDTGEMLSTSDVSGLGTGFTFEQLAFHSVMDFGDAEANGDTWGMIRASSITIGIAAAGDIVGRFRRGAVATRIGMRPKFAGLRDHARRHSNLGPKAYYNQAVRHMSTGRPFRYTRGGQTRRGFVTRMGQDRFRFTGTSMGGKRVFTHMDMTRHELSKFGITLPTGF